jgi:hypothetical protein
MQSFFSETTDLFGPHTFPEQCLPARIKAAEAELQALRERLASAGSGVADQDHDLGEATGDEAQLSTKEMCWRFLCLMSGAALLAAGLASSLSLGLFGSWSFGLGGVGAALLGAALCAGGLVLGPRP